MRTPRIAATGVLGEPAAHQLRVQQELAPTRSTPAAHGCSGCGRRRAWLPRPVQVTRALTLLLKAAAAPARVCMRACARECMRVRACLCATAVHVCVFEHCAHACVRVSTRAPASPQTWARDAGGCKLQHQESRAHLALLGRSRSRSRSRSRRGEREREGDRARCRGAVGDLAAARRSREPCNRGSGAYNRGGGLWPCAIGCRMIGGASAWIASGTRHNAPGGGKGKA